MCWVTWDREDGWLVESGGWSRDVNTINTQPSAPLKGTEEALDFNRAPTLKDTSEVRLACRSDPHHDGIFVPQLSEHDGSFYTEMINEGRILCQLDDVWSRRLSPLDFIQPNSSLSFSS